MIIKNPRIILIGLVFIAMTLIPYMIYAQVAGNNKLCIEDKLFGTKCITDPVLVELIQSKQFQRLHEIDQHGIQPYLKGSKFPQFSRFDHSIGVYLIVDKFSKIQNEKIAALLHDISHSPFSHSLDAFFNFQDSSYSHQDSIHSLFLRAQVKVQGLS